MSKAAEADPGGSVDRGSEWLLTIGLTPPQVVPSGACDFNIALVSVFLVRDLPRDPAAHADKWI